jgi:hypothetical protein
MFHGQGVFESISPSDGWKYDGQWEKDLKQGKGHRKFNCGRVEEGDWEGDTLSKGTISTKKSVCKGSFKDFKLHGPGTKEMLKDGRVYEGDFQEGELKFGEFTYPDGKKKYKGELKEWNPHGKGRTDYIDEGGHYEGYYVEGRFEGEGHRVWPTPTEPPGEDEGEDCTEELGEFRGGKLWKGERLYAGEWVKVEEGKEEGDDGKEEGDDGSQ